VKKKRCKIIRVVGITALSVLLDNFILYNGSL